MKIKILNGGFYINSSKLPFDTNDDSYIHLTAIDCINLMLKKTDADG